MTGRHRNKGFVSHYRYIDIYRRSGGEGKIVSVQISRMPASSGCTTTQEPDQTRMRPFDRSRDSDLYVEGYCEAFRQSYPGAPVSDALVSSFRASLGNLETMPSRAAFTVDAPSAAPAGFIVLGLVELAGLRHVSIEAIYVNEAHRGEGFARALLAKAAEHSRELGATGTRLDVSVGNAQARALYESAGYVVTRLQMEKPNATT